MPALCSVCVRVTSKYTCPKCQLGYCSLDCYKGHGDKCTEAFFERQVKEELSSQRATGEERRRLEQIVAQLSSLDHDDEAEEEEQEEEDEEREAERLAMLAAKADRGELTIEDLSPEEMQAFHSELKRGALGRSIEVWEPWWEKAAVFDLDGLDGEEDPFQAPAHLCCGGGREAHPSVALTLLEALYAYVHTMRVFNGEWRWEPLQAASHMLHLAKATHSKKVYEAPAECLQDVLAAAAALPGSGFGAAFDGRCLLDVAALIRRGSALRAVQEAHQILEATVEAKSSESSDGATASSLGRLRRCVKKLEFLASYACHHEEALAPLAAQAEAIEKRRAHATEGAEEIVNRKAHGGIAMPGQQDARGDDDCRGDGGIRMPGRAHG